MAILNVLKVYLEVGEHREHFDQAEQIMRQTPRPICFIFLQKPYTRWHIPQIASYADIGLWVANDFPVTFNVAKLWTEAKKAGLNAVYVLEGEKGLPQPNVMLFRNKFCERLTSEYIQSATQEQLNPVVWSGGENNVGTIKVV